LADPFVEVRLIPWKSLEAFDGADEFIDAARRIGMSRALSNLSANQRSLAQRKLSL
jgi:hypothetical protein